MLLSFFPSNSQVELLIWLNVMMGLAHTYLHSINLMWNNFANFFSSNSRQQLGLQVIGHRELMRSLDFLVLQFKSVDSVRLQSNVAKAFAFRKKTNTPKNKRLEAKHGGQRRMIFRCDLLGSCRCVCQVFSWLFIFPKWRSPNPSEELVAGCLFSNQCSNETASCWRNKQRRKWCSFPPSFCSYVIAIYKYDIWYNDILMQFQLFLFTTW